MRDMLTNNDLKKIGQVVDEKIDENNDVILGVMREGFEGMDRRFIQIDTKIDGLTTAVDGLAQNHRRFEAELAAERSARERLEERVGK